jgi:hypothetical protein
MWISLVEVVMVAVARRVIYAVVQEWNFGSEGATRG